MSYASGKTIKGQQMIKRRMDVKEMTIWGSFRIWADRDWEGNNGTRYLNDSLKLEGHDITAYYLLRVMREMINGLIKSYLFIINITSLRYIKIKNEFN